MRVPYLHSALFVRDAIFLHVRFTSGIRSRKERLRRRNQRDRDRRAAESAQQREALLARWIEAIVLRGLLPSGREFGSQERAIRVRDSRPEKESFRVGASLSAIETTSRPDSVLSHSRKYSDPTTVCHGTQQISTIV